MGMEVFSGTAELSRAFSDVAGEFLTFEKLDSDKEDVMTTAGLNLLLQRVCRIQSHGILWMGTPCRSWVALSRSWTRRSLLQPAGPSAKFTSKKQRAYLDEHNAIASLTSLPVAKHGLGLRDPAHTIQTSWRPIAATPLWPSGVLEHPPKIQRNTTRIFDWFYA